MKKSTNFIKNNYKALIVGFITALIISGTTTYATILYQASDVNYDNSVSGLSAANVKDAIDELHQRNSCPIPIDFKTSSWDDIIDAYNHGNIEPLQEAMEEGTTRNINLGGEFGVHQLRIANLSTPSECSGSGFSQTACGFVIEFANLITSQRMNPYDQNGSVAGDGNKGGWPASELRTYLNSTIYNSLPSDLKNKIISTTVVSGYGSNDSSNFTSTDKLYLLSSHEVWEDVDGDASTGIDYYDTAYNKTRQLDYYSSKNITTSNYSGIIKQKNSSAVSYWLRTSVSTNYHRFFIVYTSGTWTSDRSDNSYWVLPAFRIG